MTLATYGPEGVWAAAVFYAHDQFDLYFLSAKNTRHVMNLLSSPRAAATIQEDYADWTDIRGIQLEGIVQHLQGEARQSAIALFQTKYSFLNQASPPLRLALEKTNWFRLQPDRLYFVDNSKGFGHRDEILMSHRSS